MIGEYLIVVFATQSLTWYYRMATKPSKEPSNYMQELTRYLSNIMNSVLLALPADIKGFIYFDALSHASSAILVFMNPVNGIL